MMGLSPLSSCAEDKKSSTTNTSITKPPIVTNVKLFGVPITSNALSLLKEVEAAYDKKIKEEMADMDLSYRAESEVTKDGTPVIRLNKNRSKNETDIVHELWHLKLNAEGSPEVGWHPLTGASPIINQAFTKNMNELVYDPILHAKFYPEMRKWGYIPDFSEKENIAIFIQNIPSGEKENEINGSVAYFQACLEIDDPSLIAQFEEWYKQHNLHHPLAVGKSMVEIFKTSKSDTPEQQIDIYIKCLNLLLENTAQFKVGRYGTKMLGTFSRREVVIVIMPPNKKKS